MAEAGAEGAHHQSRVPHPRSEPEDRRARRPRGARDDAERRHRLPALGTTNEEARRRARRLEVARRPRARARARPRARARDAARRPRAERQREDDAPRPDRGNCRARRRRVRARAGALRRHVRPEPRGARPLGAAATGALAARRPGGVPRSLHPRRGLGAAIPLPAGSTRHARRLALGRRAGARRDREPHAAAGRPPDPRRADERPRHPDARGPRGEPRSISRARSSS